MKYWLINRNSVLSSADQQSDPVSWTWIGSVVKLKTLFHLCSWTGSRSLLRSGRCATCCGRTRGRTTALRKPRNTSATTASEAAPISTGTASYSYRYWSSSLTATGTSPLLLPEWSASYPADEQQLVNLSWLELFTNKGLSVDKWLLLIRSHTETENKY